MQSILKDAVQQAGVGNNHELAGDLLAGFEMVRTLIEQTKPEHWSGRPRNSTKDHIDDFLRRDPIFNALHASLSESDQLRGTVYADQFELNARDVLARVQKLAVHHHIEPENIKNVERAYVCILYMNTIEGIRNPVRDTFLGTQAGTYRELLAEINRAEVDRAREILSYELILAYAEQVACIDNPAPKGARWLRQLWTDLAPRPESGDERDFRGDLGELREDLQSISETFEAISRYCAGAPFTIEEEDALAARLFALNTKAGLRHLAQSDVVHHLSEEGIGSYERLSHLMHLALVHEKGVGIPALLREDDSGKQIIALAAQGAFANRKIQEPEPFQIAMRFDLERKIRGDVAFCEAFEAVTGTSKSAVTSDPLLRPQVYSFYRSVRGVGADIPVDDIVSTGCNIRRAGLLNGLSMAILEGDKGLDYPLQGYAFLRNLGILGVHNVNGLRGLHLAFGTKMEERVGALAESGVAVKLIECGHQVLSVRKIGPKSGHIDYDIVARIGGEIYGIEVKSSAAALQQKNFSREGQYEHSQLYKLTAHALIDGLKPAVICYDLRGIGILRVSLVDMWEGVSRLTGGVTPAIFDRSGNQFHLY